MPIGLSAFAASLWAGIPKTTSTNWDGSQTKQETAALGTGTSMPPGLEATLEYNSLLMHDRTVLDKYRVIGMDGVTGGPDIRDNREANPSDVGETPFDAQPGGRTIMLTGRIEAHNIAKLRDMQQSLRTAFYSMQERPLIFHVGSSNRDVQIYARMIDKISMPEKQDDDRPWRDFSITLRASDPRFRSVVDRIASVNYGALDTFTKQTAVLYTNQVVNTRAEINANGLTLSANGTNSGATFGTAADTTFLSNNVFRANITGASGMTQVSCYSAAPNGVAAATSIGTGKRYFFRAQVRIASIAGGGSATNLTCSARVTNASGTYLQDAGIVGGANYANPTTGATYYIVGYTDTTAIFNSAPTAAQIGFNIAVNLTGTVTAIDIRYGNLMICEVPPTQTAAPDFFDGDAYRGRWTGAPCQSTSEYLADDYVTGSNFDTSGLQLPNGGLWFDGARLRMRQFANNSIIRRTDVAPLTDFRTTMKIIMPPVLYTEGGGGPGIWNKGLDNNNMIMTRFQIVNSTTGRIDIQLYLNAGSTFTTLAVGTGFTIIAGSNYWLRAQIVGNVCTSYVYNTDPSVGSPTPLQTTTYTLTGSNATTIGSGIPGYAGLWHNTFTGHFMQDDMRIEPLALATTVPVINAGNYLALPKIRLYGPMTNPVVTNQTIMPDETTSRSVKINGTIPAGSYYEYDAQKGTLIDNTGANQFAKYDITSKQLQYASGANLLGIVASGLSDVTPQFISTHQDTWI